MPLPWKKNRVTRISQIVADLQSPRRGGSLVVETGFPTSLIDLFVKNRSRFTRLKSKRPLQHDISDPPPPPPSTPVPETSTSGNLTPLVTVDDDGDDGGVSGSEEVNRVGECGYSKSVVAASVKLKALLLVVVLMTSVMKLTVGITVSAVTLLFLENVGKRFVVWWRNVVIIMEPLTRKCVWFQNLKLKRKKEEEEVVAGVVGAGLSSSTSLSFNEIEVVESESRSHEVGGCCSEEEACFVVDPCEKKLCLLEEEVSSDSCEGSRSGRFKSKMAMKKLVPKKWRSSLRKRSNKESSEVESPRSGNEEKCSREEDEVDGSNNNNNGTIMTTWVVEEEEEDEDVISESDRIHQVGNCYSSGYVIVLMTALALGGLVMGRLAALILTLASSFLLKMLLPPPRKRAKSN
ncbi:hypothetical protein PIB30_020775 [Stylosanthes scabra]|uniref:Transmembrane protein n=1 Tax=Stylosanthes scabra TaxID=79078 RepID=A0ABU6R927_9FABA|nr:hypothetical protein [Stylosanthes scabra]